MTTEIYFWIGFILFVMLMLAIDLGIFHRKTHAVSFKESLAWTFVWIGLAMLFSTLVYFWKGPEKSIEFLTGYIIELSLNVDNLFVFILIFSYFHVPLQYQHKAIASSKSSIVVMFKEQRRSIFQKLFLSGASESIAFQTKVPMLVLNKTPK